MSEALLNAGRQTLMLELQEASHLPERLGDDFVRAANIILHCEGKVVVSGIGKSGHIGKKIAATLASTGTPAFFVHPAEALHGDLGMIESRDVMLFISYSGGAKELDLIIPRLEDKSIALLAMTGKPTSPLGLAAKAVLDISVEREACPMHLAPTSSTVNTLMMGDALAMGVEFYSNVCNYQKPAAGEPALLLWDDVITLFHEFGHTLHGLFARQRYATLSGTNTPRDFVEFPSQINEHWATHPQVFARYARHYQSRAAMPDELQQKMRNASLFNKGYEMSELLSAALLDMRWHCLEENEAMQDVDDFELRALVAENMDLPAIPPRYRSSYFAHIFGGGYAAGYYAYLWTQMLADDGYQWFVEQGGLTRENGRRFREAILSRGNSEDLERLYRQWRGKAPQIMPMLQHRGLNV